MLYGSYMIKKVRHSMLCLTSGYLTFKHTATDPREWDARMVEWMRLN